MRVNNAEGFTLIEVIVTVVIIGVLATIAVPNYLNWLPNMRLKGNARDLYANIQRAKLEASRRNSCIGIAFTTVAYPATGGGYTVFVDDGNGGGTSCNKTLDGTEKVLTSDVVDRDVSLTTVTFGGTPPSLCFSSTTVTCGSQSGNIQLRNNNSRWFKATIHASGGVKLESSGDGATWNF